MMSTDERLAYMADQIARNFATLGKERAIAATADHIASFWDPRMKQRALALIDGERPDWMTEMATLSLRFFREHCTLGPQTADPVGCDDAG